MNPAVDHLLRTILHGSLDIVLPPTCTYCGGDAELRRWGLCGACARDLRATAPASACPRCAMPRPALGGGPADCPLCQKQPFRFSGAIAVGLYRGMLREAVIAAKQASHQPLAVSLGRLAADAVTGRFSSGRPDLVTAVPSYWRRRLRRRGTPAQVLAETIAADLDIRHVVLLKCTRQTEKQGTLSPQKRKTNVHGAFCAKTGYAFGAARWPGQGRHILLVDDVLTTGATCNAAAGALLDSGAVRVTLAVVARAVG